MAYIKAEIKIPQIGRTLPVSLYFPTDLPEEVGNKVRGVITLLHGLTNTGDDWMMMSAATRYAADNGYILVAPGMDNSFYADMAYGPAFYTTLTQYLPDQLDAIFRIPHEREVNYIAGLSMGGYGALRVGLAHPERYAAIGSFSGAADPAWMTDTYRDDPAMRPMLTSVLGEDARLPRELDPFYLAEKVAALPKSQQPRLLCTCGRQDDVSDILRQNAAFREHAQRLGLDYTYAEWDGVHEWNFWDRSLAEFIGFIQNSDYGARKCGDWASPVTLHQGGEERTVPSSAVWR